MSVRSAQSVTVLFTTRVFSTGVGTNADSTPTGTLYVNGTADAASVTVTNISTGLYKAAVTLPTLAVNDEVEIVIAATVSSVSDKAVIWGDTKDVFAGAIPDVAAGGTNGLFIAGTNAATAITTGLTANIVGNITGNLSGSVGSVSGQLTAAQIATGVWQDATAGDFTTASSIGKSLYTGNVIPGGTNGLFIAGTNAATAITTGLTANIVGNITGNLSGSVGSVTGNVGGNVVGSVASVSGAVGSVTGAVGSVTGAVGSVTGNVGGNVTGSVASVVAAVAITSNRKKASACTIEFLGQLATTGAATTGLTFAFTISKDGGASVATANSPTEIGLGQYQLVLTGTEMTANNLFIQGTATGALLYNQTIQTQP